MNMLEALRRARSDAASRRDQIVTDAEKRGKLTDADQIAFDSARAEVDRLDSRIAEEEETERRAATAAGVHASVGATGEGYDRRVGGARVGLDEPYRRGAGQSYFQDLVRARHQPTPAVNERLARHAEQMDRALAAGEVEKRSRLFATPADLQGLEVRVSPSRVDGQGGYFVPPLWLIEEYVDYARPGRAVADLYRPIPLPPGTDSVNLPKVSTGTQTGIQTADGAPVTSVDLADTVVTGPVRTIAGQQDFALQLLEQSPGNFDEVIYRDLTSDYNKQLDLQCINGTGANGQLLGLLNVSGINAVTYTDASPTLPEMWVPIMQAASKVANGVFSPATAFATSASEWYFLASQLDTTSRPLLGGLGPNNSMGSVLRAAQNSMGQIGPWNAIGDANMPGNLGGGTNETRAVLAAWDELYLFEGTVRTRVLMEVLSGTLQVRIQLYNYVASIPQRRPTAISVISGTGMVPGAGF
jgi:HK97 family phage major capsid protein